MNILSGICGSKGYASGQAVVKTSSGLELHPYEVINHEEEIGKFRETQDSYEKKLTELQGHSAKELGEEAAEIFSAYKIILRDEAFFKKAIDRMMKENVSLAYLIDSECKKVSAMFASMEDPYLRERAVDIENVCREICRMMTGAKDDFVSELSHVSDAVAVGEDFTPEETVKMDKTRLRAFVSEKGGVTSHTVILAKALGIPAMVGVAGATEKIRSHDHVLVDACSGTVTINPDGGQSARFEELREKQRLKTELYGKTAGLPAETLDGFHVDININAGDEDSVKAFDPAICDGIGLFRTEFLYMSHTDYPDENLQFEAYKNVAQKAGGKEVIIRTLDIGGDKHLDYMDLPTEENPFLGYRAIRLCLDRKEVFHTQLRAILRASAFGNVKIMFPMIVNLEELREAKECVEKAKKSLKEEGCSYREDIPVGIMVETPAAAFLSDILAAECDFFSIGSNDLIQYITASDRMNENVQHLYDSCNISVIRAIKMTADSAEKHGIPWGICGEVASDGRLVPLWVAMGASELSVSPSQSGYIKYLVRRMNRGQIADRLDGILSAGLIEEVKASLNGILNDLEAGNNE